MAENTMDGPNAVPNAGPNRGHRGDMMIHESLRTNVLPTDRLLVNGMAVPNVRAELRRIPNLRNAISVAMVWVWIATITAVVVRLDHPAAWIAGVVLMCSMQARLLILMHEAAHKLLFSHKRANDFVGKWIVAYPGWSPIGIYRRSHFAHHREEFGAEEPDIPFYAGYRTTPKVIGRRLARDAVGISGWKNLKPLVRGLKNPNARPTAIGILGTQMVLVGVFWIATQRWYTWPVLGFGSWMTGWRFINRLRAIAEHGGLGQSSDRRATTHHVRQSLLARFWMVPFNTGWHLAHHVDMGIPFRNLPAFHAELVAAGYATDAITYPSYISLWKALASEQRANWRPVRTVASL
jgi:fatty acid desaturase